MLYGRSDSSGDNHTGWFDTCDFEPQSRFHHCGRRGFHTQPVHRG